MVVNVSVIMQAVCVVNINRLFVGRITGGYPEEGGGVQFMHTNRSAILGVANTVSRLGIPALFPVMPELLVVCVSDICS